MTSYLYLYEKTHYQIHNSDPRTLRFKVQVMNSTRKLSIQLNLCRRLVKATLFRCCRLPQRSTWKPCSDLGGFSDRHMGSDHTQKQKREKNAYKGPSFSNLAFAAVLHSKLYSIQFLARVRLPFLAEFFHSTDVHFHTILAS